jgi:hypothetical protein
MDTASVCFQFSKGPLQEASTSEIAHTLLQAYASPHPLADDYLLQVALQNHTPIAGTGLLLGYLSLKPKRRYPYSMWDITVAQKDVSHGVWGKRMGLLQGTVMCSQRKDISL